MVFGYIIKEFWYALFLVSIVKIVGFTIAFYLAKCFLKEKLEYLFEENVYFKSFSGMVVKKPYTMITLLKVMHIPSFLKYYGVGILPVRFIEFFWPTGMIYNIKKYVFHYIFHNNFFFIYF